MVGSSTIWEVCMVGLIHSWVSICQGFLNFEDFYISVWLHCGVVTFVVGFCICEFLHVGCCCILELLRFGISTFCGFYIFGFKGIGAGSRLPGASASTDPRVIDPRAQDPRPQCRIQTSSINSSPAWLEDSAGETAFSSRSRHERAVLHSLQRSGLRLPERHIAQSTCGHETSFTRGGVLVGCALAARMGPL